MDLGASSFGRRDDLQDAPRRQMSFACPNVLRTSGSKWDNGNVS
jgi:hypothetical protein